MLLHPVPHANSAWRASATLVTVLLSALMIINPLHTRALGQTGHATHGSAGATHPTARPAAARGESVPLLDNLGRWHRAVNTTVPMAQRYFDQGLRLYYAFNHAESVRAFREAQRLDPRCVMCVWGEAMAFGPNMNAPMDERAEAQAVAATKRAVGLLPIVNPTDSERAFVRAIELRFIGQPGITRASRDSAYARAMASIADRHPDDADVLALAAESAMDLSPWTYWNKDGSARPGTTRLLSWLQRGLRQTPDHPGLCHFYIHAVEAVHPERAVACAERLAALMPGAGHIVHMPAHIYIRVGRWADAIDINKHAVHADEQYFDGPHTPESGFYAAAYQSHNHHFLTLAAVMAGASATAIESSREVTKIVTPELARIAPAVEALLAVPVQTLLTFGKWREVLELPLPPNDLRIALSHTWYARGIAFAATGRASEARATVDSIRAVEQSLPEGEPKTTLVIAQRLVLGEIALRRGDADAAVLHMRDAAALEDGLSYMEPPTWFYPVRHSLGKALLAAGKPRDAERVYREDLKRFPENGWALRGLALALTAQGREKDATAAMARFAKAWRNADVRIEGSRY